MTKVNKISVLHGDSFSRHPIPKSVAYSDAEYTTLLQAVEVNAPGGLIFLPLLSRVLYYNYDLLELILFLVDSGCRISEALDLQLNDFVGLNSVKIASKKGSNERVVSLSFSRDYMMRCRVSGRQPFSFINYMYVYRAFKELGIQDKFGRNGVNSVTHYFRHVNQILLKNDGVSTRTISQNMGHKSLKSTTHYLQNGKKSNNKNSSSK